jgi:hypothetical protein
LLTIILQRKRSNDIGDNTLDIDTNHGDQAKLPVYAQFLDPLSLTILDAAQSVVGGTSLLQVRH